MYNNMSNYNSKDLKLSINRTLIIIDWDDTLFPSSWAVYNKINLNSESDKIKYSDEFQKLDFQLSQTISRISKYGKIIIITNALLDWIRLTLTVLPKTAKALENIDIISAREKQQNTNPLILWKTRTFLEVIKNNSGVNNIISLGDAEYEYKALINLFNDITIPHKYLKSVKFIKSNNYQTAIEQIIFIRKEIKEICKKKRHIDLTFEKA